MDDGELLQLIGKRAHDADTRLDIVDGRAPALPPRATAAEIATAESELGFEVHPFHALLLSSVANGGFGPGYGLYGLGKRGHRDNVNGDAVGVRRCLAENH